MADVYGLDLDCIDDLQQTLATTSGRTVLGQRLARMTITPKGRLINNPHWGFGVQLYLNKGVSLDGSILTFIARGLEEAYRQDEAVLGAVVAVSFALGVLTTVATIQDAAGPFTLTLAVSAVTIQILGLA
jgi:hypothetical protein